MNHGKRQKTNKQLSEERNSRRNAKLAAKKTKLLNLQVEKAKAHRIQSAREHATALTGILYRLNIDPLSEWLNFRGHLYKYWITESK